MTEELVSSDPVVTSNPLLLYDGVCGLCNRTVQLILRQERAQTFRFAALQSPFASRILSRHGIHPEKLDTVYLVLQHDLPDERLLARSDAVIAVLKELTGFWRALGSAFGLVPRFLRDWIYSLIARHRYRVFGRYDACPVPTPQTRARFLDQ